jgi:cytochrome P450
MERVRRECGVAASEKESLAVTAAPPAPLFDPFAPGFTDDPYPQYAALREAAPVYEHPLGFWLLTRYDDVSWLLRGGLSVEDRNLADGPLLQLREQLRGGELPRDKLSMLDSTTCSPR